MDIRTVQSALEFYWPEEKKEVGVVDSWCILEVKLSNQKFKKEEKEKKAFTSLDRGLPSSYLRSTPCHSDRDIRGTAAIRRKEKEHFIAFA